MQTFDRLLHHLPERAQDRVRRFRHPDDAVRSLAARLLPTWYLREAGIVAPSEHPKFGVAPRGKPYLLDPTAKVGFNTTHEGEYVLLAVGDGEVGVDVMDLPKDPQELEEGISFQVSGKLRQCLIFKLMSANQGRTTGTVHDKRHHQVEVPDYVVDNEGGLYEGDWNGHFIWTRSDKCTCRGRAGLCSRNRRQKRPTRRLALGRR